MLGRKRSITIVVATRHGGALAALEEAGKGLPLARREALSTDGVYRALPGAHLAVVDLDALIESPGVPREQLVQILAGGEAAAEDGVREQVEEIFEELVVLDSAGRLQVPKEYLEQFGIKGRVRLELTEEGVLILPAPESAHAQAAGMLAAGLVPGPGARGWRSHSAFAVLRTAGGSLRGLASRLRRGTRAQAADGEGEGRKR
jgi:hypothetical protein